MMTLTAENNKNVYFSQYVRIIITWKKLFLKMHSTMYLIIMILIKTAFSKDLSLFNSFKDAKVLISSYC